MEAVPKPKDLTFFLSVASTDLSHGKVTAVHAMTSRGTGVITFLGQVNQKTEDAARVALSHIRVAASDILGWAGLKKPMINLLDPKLDIKFILKPLGPALEGGSIGAALMVCLASLLTGRRVSVGKKLWDCMYLTAPVPDPYMPHPCR